MGAEDPSLEPSSPVSASSGVPRLGKHDDRDLREGYQARAQEFEPYLHCTGDRWLCVLSGLAGEKGEERGEWGAHGTTACLLNLLPERGGGSPRPCLTPLSLRPLARGAAFGYKVDKTLPH